MKLLAALLVTAALAPAARADTDPSPRDQVNKVIQDRMDDFRDCYLQRVKLKTKLAGKLVVIITIDPKGNVFDVKISQSLDDEVDACVAKTMKTLTFPAPGQQVKIKYPFDFHK